VKVTDLTVEVRDANLARVGAITPDWWDWTATVKLGEPGEWKIRLPAEHPLAPALTAQGAGIIVTHADPAVGTLLSGPASSVVLDQSTDDTRGTWTVTGTTDEALLWTRVVYPDPDHSAGYQSAGYDVRTGPAETVLLAYADFNLGAATLPARQAPGVTVATSQGRGAQVTRSERFSVLGEVASAVAAAGGLAVHVLQTGSTLEVGVSELRDVTDLVRLDMLNSTLASHSAGVSVPAVTRVLVAGQGEGEKRTIIERADAAAEAGYGPYGRRETFIDQRQTDDADELTQAGDKALAEGAAGSTVTAVPGDSQTMRYPQDWTVGDTVAIVVDGREESAQVTSATIVAGTGGVTIGAGIGDVQGWDPQAGLRAQTDAVEARVSHLERTAEGGGAGLPDTVPAVTDPGLTAATGWTISDTYFTVWGPLRFFRARFTRTGGDITASNGNVPDTDMGMLPDGWHPPDRLITLATGGSYSAEVLMRDDGDLVLLAAGATIATGDSIQVTTIYPVAP
jgi:hypothetical protein